MTRLFLITITPKNLKHYYDQLKKKKMYVYIIKELVILNYVHVYNFKRYKLYEI